MLLRECIFSLLIVCCVSHTLKRVRTEEEAAEWLAQYDIDMTAVLHDYVVADWAYNTNITDENLEAMLAAASTYAAFSKEKGLEALEFDYSGYTDESIIRQLKIIEQLGTAALSEEDVAAYNELVSSMSSLYSMAKICPPDNKQCDLETEGWPLEPDIEDFMAASTNYEDLTYVWEEWREKSGKAIKDDYYSYIDLGNKAADLNGFNDMGGMWLEPYQMDLENCDFKDEVERLWQDVLPLYEQLHAYVRHRLREFYGNDYVMGPRDPIPAHIFGNMWAQGWDNIYEMVKPFRGTSEVDITEALQEQGYDAEAIFKDSDSFFASIGQRPMPDTFWTLSMLEKPTDRDVVCHASAWDFLYNDDVRVKQCTNINMEDYITAHHEMGHTEYFLLYGHLPLTFREGANPGFHEAVGDTISLSVQTPQHLYAVGLLGEPDDTYRFNINYLMKMALQKLAFLPFGYLIDLYRWDLFSNVVTKEESNYHWWKLREKYQGIVPPVHRSKDQFDAGSKYHVPADVPYIRYFVAHIMQFDFYKTACEAAGLYPGDRLHKCDYYQSTEAGAALTKGLEVGASLPWPETLELMTGNSQMTASSLIDYFQPLLNYLEDYNTNNNIEIGWNTGVFEEWVD